MVELIRDLHADHLRYNLHDREQDFCKRTAAIVAELPKPVDPAVLAVREAVARRREAVGLTENAVLWRSGQFDSIPDFQDYLAAFNAGRESANA